MLKLKGNIVGNYSIMAVNMLSPLIILPLLTNRYTKLDFSHYSIFQAVVAYIITFVEFGFLTSGTNRIARSNSSSSNIYFITSSIIRIFLAVISTLCFTILVLLKLFDFSALTIFSAFIMAFSTAILPFWAINGKQQSGIYAYNYIILRLICIGFFITATWLRYDIEKVILFYALSFLVPAIFTFLSFYLKNLGKFSFKFKYFKVIFLNNIAMAQSSMLAIATNGSIIVVASFVMSPDGVAELSLGEKITRLVLALIAPFAMSSLPNLSKAFFTDKFYGFKKLLIYSTLSAVFYAAIAIAILLNSNYIYIIFGAEYENLSFLSIMLGWGLVSLVNNFIGVQFFVINGFSHLYNRIFAFGFIAQIIFYAVLGKFLGPIGVPVAVLLIEIGLSITFFTIALSRIYGKTS